jgi:hypothetical protein
VTAGLALLVAASSALAAGLTPLYVIPTDDRSARTVSAPDALTLALQTTDAEGVVRRLGAGAERVDASTVRYAAVRSPLRPFVADQATRWLAATFVIDHDERPILTLRDEFRKFSPSSPSASTLAEFVGSRVQDVAGEPWEPASITAQKLRGDCTEHAVLAAALARALGMPARVVTGIVVTRAPGEPFAAFGHAWAEVREGDHWRVADAALGPSGLPVYYVPLGLLEDEGPGFMLQLMQDPHVSVSRVVVLGTS